jgi:hypothetical protein
METLMPLGRATEEILTTMNGVKFLMKDEEEWRCLAWPPLTFSRTDSTAVTHPMGRNKLSFFIGARSSRQPALSSTKVIWGGLLNLLPLIVGEVGILVELSLEALDFF